MIKGEQIFINGDGETSRDFCYIENVIQINLLAATATAAESKNQVYNVAVGDRTTLNNLFIIIKDALSELGFTYELQPQYREFRTGDVKHSLADISKASSLLHYKPSHQIIEGLKEAMVWYAKGA